jgi:hypothetical protein
MNANELADKLMSSLTMEYDCDEYMKQAATMLRQQQEQINNLKQWEKRQLDLIESLELQLHTTLTNRNLEKPAKYSDAWWKEVAEFNKARKAQKK